MTNISKRANARRYYLKRAYVTKICECGCNEAFKTVTKKSRFKNISHYTKYKAMHNLKHKKQRKKVFKLNKPYMIQQKGII